eukprot:2185889-Pyramimonas_sp.AAC.1
MGRVSEGPRPFWMVEEMGKGRGGGEESLPLSCSTPTRPVHEFCYRSSSLLASSFSLFPSPSAASS